MLQLCMPRRDYYDVLSVAKGASESQLKRAYRKLALKYHPVSVGGNGEGAVGIAAALRHIYSRCTVLRR